MRQGQGHDVLGKDLAEAAAETGPLAEGCDLVGAGPFRRPEQQRNRVEAVRLHLAGRGVIAGDDNHVRVQFHELGQLRVKGLDHLDLAGEVAILARAVGVFVVDEEEVERVPVRPGDLELVGQVLARVEDRHPDQLGQAAVHGVNGDGRRPEAIKFVERHDLRMLGEPAQHQEIGRGLVLQDLPGLPQKLGGDLRCLLRGGITGGGRRLESEMADRARVGVGDLVPQPLAAEPDDQAILAHGLDQGLDPVDLYPGAASRRA